MGDPGREAVVPLVYPDGSATQDVSTSFVCNTFETLDVCSGSIAFNVLSDVTCPVPPCSTGSGDGRVRPVFTLKFLSDKTIHLFPNLYKLIISFFT